MSEKQMYTFEWETDDLEAVETTVSNEAGLKQSSQEALIAEFF